MWLALHCMHTVTYTRSQDGDCQDLIKICVRDERPTSVKELGMSGGITGRMGANLFFFIFLLRC